MRTRSVLCAVAACLLPALALAQAQGTLEERLRAQLRTLNGQNQQLQADKASAQAAQRAAEGERDAARKALAVLQDELDASRQRAQGLAARQRQVEAAAAAQAREAQGQRDSAQQAAREQRQQLAAAAQEQTRLAETLHGQEARLARCNAMNARLQATAKEILAAYERIDVLDALAYRQPFAASARVKLERQVQDFGDRLHEDRFDPRAEVPAARPAPDQDKGTQR
ncbi:hypothetical protein [Cupriavidus sp. USMAA2-4]|uniref:hypothetical protein n=1 Tax=Cupriavidus sp. USMAA2-4 TaxID=876364 RepID=UPI0009FBD30B|nr:hypothetical protein [Cupriavidus sp. USMAA2-4]